MITGDEEEERPAMKQENTELEVAWARVGRKAIQKGTFSPGWSYQPGLKVSLVPGAKNTGTTAKFRSGSNVVSLLVGQIRKGLYSTK